MFNPMLLHHVSSIRDTYWLMLGGTALLALFVLIAPRRPLSRFSSGFACGGVALINPAFSSCYPVWVVYGWWRTRRRTDKALHFAGYTAVLLTGFVLAILSWTIRNYHAFGELIYMRGNAPRDVGRKRALVGWIRRRPQSLGQEPYRGCPDDRSW